MSKPESKAGWALPVIVIFALTLAWANRFVQDDAFISFRYARNFAEGHGLVWNVGERVEGYTNFLWTVCLAPAWLLGLDPVGFAYGLSLAAMAVTLLASYRLTLALGARREAGLLCVFLLATNYSFSCYGTGGLETQFVAAWVTSSAWLLTRQLSAWCALGTSVAAGLTSACAVMTRMDAVVLLGPFWVWRIFAAWRLGERRTWLALSAGALAGAVPVAFWLAWRHSYYGAWVPNTFLIKSSGVSCFRGAYYVGLFYLVYGLWLALPACMSGLRRLGPVPVAVCAASAGALWSAYVVAVGGDFMEFRMMVPGLPLVFVCVAAGIEHGCLTQRWRLAVAAAQVLCSVAHGALSLDYRGVQSIRELKACDAEWREVAAVLSLHLGKDCETVKIAVTAAGIIPYHTRCQTLDLLGLNDREVARRGERVEPVSRWLGNRPGHVRIASREMVKDRGVNLLLNKPWVTDEVGLAGRSARELCAAWSLGSDSDSDRVHAARVRYSLHSDEAVPCVVAWPMSGGRFLMSLYVCQNSAVDSAIERCRARVIGE